MLIESLFERLIARLLYVSNQKSQDYEFYEIKEKALLKHGVDTGNVYQVIEDACYGTDWDIGCEGSSCYKCGGSGIYRKRVIMHQSFELHRYKFLVYKQEGFSVIPGEATVIVGRLQRKWEFTFRSSIECKRWLYFILGEWGALRTSLCHERPGGNISILRPMEIIGELCRFFKYSLILCYECKSQLSLEGDWCPSCKKDVYSEPRMSFHEEEIPF